MADQGARPTVATVFAILHFVFGAIAALIAIVGIFTAFSLFKLFGSGAIAPLIYFILGLTSTVVMILAGVSLIANKSNAIQMNLYYVFASVGVTVINTIMSIASTTVNFSVVAILIGLAYPALVFFLIVKNEEVKSFYASA